MSDSEEQLGTPGNVIIEECKLYLHDGTDVVLRDMSDPGKPINYVAEINIYEGIFDKYLTGSIRIEDAANIITDAPIMGGEVFYLKLRTPTLDDTPANVIEKEFRVFSILDRDLNEDRSQGYTLEFMSIEGMADQNQILQQRYKGNTEDIIREIYDKNIKISRKPMSGGTAPTGLWIGDTPHSSNVSFISNKWTPMQTLDYMSKYIRGNKHDGADFVFYESNKDFYFTSLQQLISTGKDAMLDEYVYAQPSQELPRRSVGSFTSGWTPAGWVTITEMKIPRTIDIIDGQDSGFYAQSVRAYDLFSKERMETRIDAREDFDKFVHTEDGIPIPHGAEGSPHAMTAIKVLNSANNITQSYNIPGAKGGNSDNMNVIASSVLRDNYFSSFKDYTFEIDVPGRTDIEVGKMIYVAYPAPRSKTEDLDFDQIFDKQLSGKYLITHIRHKIDNAGYVMMMEIQKNGLPESLGPVAEGG